MGKYFKGYYFKCCEGDKSFALIPALHTDGKRYAASLQIITNDNVYVIPYSNIKFWDDTLKIKIGRNIFSLNGIFLDAYSNDCRLYGKLYFGKLQNINYNIMGPFQYIHFMQCRHSIISMCHSVTGKVNINHTVYNLKNGMGYIEGDSGRSFPKEYIWTQCHFRNGSLMLAVADIPMLGLNFKGIIGIILIDGKEYRIATYLGARLFSVGENEVFVTQGEYTFYAKLLEPKHQRLNAPVNGRMVRMIHESVSCKAFYQLTYKNRVMLEFVSDNASFEYEMKIL